MFKITVFKTIKLWWWVQINKKNVHFISLSVYWHFFHWVWPLLTLLIAHIISLPKSKQCLHHDVKWVSFYDPHLHFLQQTVQRRTKWVRQWKRDARWTQKGCHLKPVHRELYERHQLITMLSFVTRGWIDPYFPLPMSLSCNVLLENYLGKQKVSPAISGAPNPPAAPEAFGKWKQMFHKMAGRGTHWRTAFYWLPIVK